ncbi:MAG: DnaD domain protein [Oscillospiraceae bacterium]|nr:DnaD domain protein [Oscillospiraceae bacterium]
MAKYTLPGTGSISMSADAADKLISRGDGEVALVYLCILRSDGDISPDKIAADLNISKTAVEKAFAALAAMELISASSGEQQVSYTASDIAKALENPEFAFLSDEVERIFGTFLAFEERKILFNIYTNSQLPPEVILLMTQFFKNDIRRRYGPGRRLNMVILERTAFEWRRMGIDTLDKAEEYIKKRDNAYSLEGEIKRVLGIFDRKLVQNEKQYIDSWIEMGFKADAVQIAYERTIGRLHNLSLPYMDKILLSWHSKNLHTAEEINSGDPYEKRRKASGEGISTETATPAVPTQDEADRLLRFFESMKEDNQ